LNVDSPICASLSSWDDRYGSLHPAIEQIVLKGRNRGG
jgi:hypothetical protein